MFRTSARFTVSLRPTQSSVEFESLGRRYAFKAVNYYQDQSTSDGHIVVSVNPQDPAGIDCNPLLQVPVVRDSPQRLVGRIVSDKLPLIKAMTHLASYCSRRSAKQCYWRFETQMPVRQIMADNSVLETSTYHVLWPVMSTEYKAALSLLSKHEIPVPLSGCRRQSRNTYSNLCRLLLEGTQLAKFMASNEERRLERGRLLQDTHELRVSESITPSVHTINSRTRRIGSRQCCLHHVSDFCYCRSKRRPGPLYHSLTPCSYPGTGGQDNTPGNTSRIIPGVSATSSLFLRN